MHIIPVGTKVYGQSGCEVLVRLLVDFVGLLVKKMFLVVICDKGADLD